jgi:predicted MFS family arabinose efflux permease
VLITLAALTHARSRIDDSTLTEAVSSRDHSAHVRIAWAGLGIALSAGALQLGTYELVLKISPRTGLAVLGLVGIALTAPMLVPPGTWRMARGLPSVMLARALFVGAFYASITYVPLFLVGQRGLTLQMAGLALAVGAIGWAAGAWYQGHDHLHLPRYRLVEVGALLLAVGLAVLSAVAWLGLAWWIVPVSLVVSGVAMGLGVTTTTVLALELSPVEEHGAASSSLQLADVLGSVIGIAAATAAFAAWHVPGQDDALFGAIFLGLALVAALAVPAGQRIRS